ncbi:hypothetical protein TIFTF001_006932 [Ficus carica]|uniref:Uncharacterized protein n=1 Tax=Ficus carica TaxID=3494 RepID=A0AA88D1C5_FICCA|nr:hypothetical protein TIFTF001_006932 [Ficus carica]
MALAMPATNCARTECILECVEELVFLLRVRCFEWCRSSASSGVSRFLDQFFIFSGNNYCGGEIANSPTDVVISMANSRRDLVRRIEQMMVAISGDKSSRRWQRLAKLRTISGDMTMLAAAAAIWS